MKNPTPVTNERISKGNTEANMNPKDAVCNGEDPSRVHIQVIGATGTGKPKYLEHLLKNQSSKKESGHAKR